MSDMIDEDGNCLFDLRLCNHRELECDDCPSFLEYKDDQTEKHTIKEWSNLTGIVVLDPDGFDRTDPKLNEKLFTKEEFINGIHKSTIVKRGCL